MTVYSILTSIFPIVVLSLIQNAIYRKKQEKARYGLLVYISAVYSVVGVLIIWRNHINIEEILEGYGITSYSVIIANMLLMAGFILVKLLAGNFLKKKWTKRELIEMTSASFYSYSEEYDKWFLQHKWTNYKVFLNTIRWGIVFAAGFFLSFVNSRSGEDMITFTFPCSVVIILNEVYNFINGETKAEYEHTILGDEADSRRAGDFFRVREILEHILPDPLLSSLTGFELVGNTTPAAFVNSLSKSEDKFDRLTADYYLADNRYMRSETDGIKATLSLMHKKNVVVHDPFYRDLDIYITLPLFHALVSGKKTIVITGRMSEKEDVKVWLSDILADYTHMPSLWHADHLGPYRASCEIGVLSFSDLYDPRVIDNNAEFFKMTELVILIEPSAILSTGQIALSILAREMEKGETKPIYFVSDRMVDGLVDTLSHLLRTEFTNVVAPPIPHCAYSGITWNATGDFCRQQLFDRQTRYLGNGIEIAAVALKNQIPHVTWYGETKVPIRDISWIAGQNYPVICQYINQPPQQSVISERIDFASNLWSAKKQKEQFAIIEDEFNNMFMAMRLYISRGTNQSFVNILAEDYLLRDYMRYNQQMFLANPDAIPSIVPEYAKTERNTLIKLLILMKRHHLNEQDIIDEFHLVGVDSDSAYSLLNDTLCRFTDASADILEIDTVEVEADELTMDDVNVYSISNETFNHYFSKTLSEAYYIVENETGKEDYVDAKFFSHVTQCIMPDQYVTYDGKYYRAKHISPQMGVVLRRAANLFTERKYYRQIRSYTLSDRSEVVLSKRSKGNIEFAFIQKDISVATSGYLEMNDIHDLRTSKVVDFSNDPLVENFSRSYKNKIILRIRLTGTDPDTRYTFCLLLSELLRSLFPDGFPYIAVSTGYSDDIGEGLKHLIYSINGDIDDECIYIIEDSDIDLGLLGAIERNWERIMEILGDYLAWHFEKMSEQGSEYERDCFLKFGFEEIDARLKLDELLQYLQVNGKTENTLTQARKRDLFEKSDIDLAAVNRCDFCGRPLTGASHELLNDGRVRCNDCSASAITSVEELRELFYQAMDLMEAFYNIKYRVPINVKMVDARTVAKGVGMVFRPSTEFVSRKLGYAQMIKDNYYLVLENGSPRIAALNTVIHEMTHIWQYINWDEKDVAAAYDMSEAELTKLAKDMVYEGMAVWASIQYLYQIGESHYAASLEREAESRSDVYGMGFVLFRDQYPLKKDSSLIRITPFASFPPADPERVREQVEIIAGQSDNFS